MLLIVFEFALCFILMLPADFDLDVSLTTYLLLAAKYEVQN